MIAMLSIFSAGLVFTPADYELDLLPFQLPCAFVMMQKEGKQKEEIYEKLKQRYGYETNDQIVEDVQKHVGNVADPSMKELQRLNKVLKKNYKMFKGLYQKVDIAAINKEVQEYLKQDGIPSLDDLNRYLIYKKGFLKDSKAEVDQKVQEYLQMDRIPLLEDLQRYLIYNNIQNQCSKTPKPKEHIDMVIRYYVGYDGPEPSFGDLDKFLQLVKERHNPHKANPNNEMRDPTAEDRSLEPLISPQELQDNNEKVRTVLFAKTFSANADYIARPDVQLVIWSLETAINDMVKRYHSQKDLFRNIRGINAAFLTSGESAPASLSTSGKSARASLREILESKELTRRWIRDNKIPQGNVRFPETYYGTERKEFGQDVGSLDNLRKLIEHKTPFVFKPARGSNALGVHLFNFGEEKEVDLTQVEKLMVKYAAEGYLFEEAVQDPNGKPLIELKVRFGVGFRDYFTTLYQRTPETMYRMKAGHAVVALMDKDGNFIQTKGGKESEASRVLYDEFIARHGQDSDLYNSMISSAKEITDSLGMLQGRIDFFMTSDKRLYFNEIQRSGAARYVDFPNASEHSYGMINQYLIQEANAVRMMQRDFASGRRKINLHSRTKKFLDRANTNIPLKNP